MTDIQDKNLINASPTKDFFISMLVRDIELIDAVADLVDNCVDGARKTRGIKTFKKLWVKIELDGSRFQISDNCGGIPPNLARDYAFRFGRPKEFQGLKHSIGNFGIGMKRAIFKIGNHFAVESTTKHSFFKIDQDVNSWKAQSDSEPWHFEFKKLEEKNQPVDEIGTSITISKLHAGVASEFGLENFRTKLISKIGTKHGESVNRGLSISVNGVGVPSSILELFLAKKIRPVSQSFRMPNKVKVRLYAGVSESDPLESGWNVFCNGRLVLGSDKTEKTGWGEGRGKKIPSFHNQFARFRGFVFFDSDEADVLPWNTTKTDVDPNSPIYQAVREKMIVAMRPIIDFLNDLDREGTAAKVTGRSPLARMLNSAKPTKLSDIGLRAQFGRPQVETIAVPSGVQRISYRKKTTEIQRVKKALQVSSLKEVGEHTFDYFYQAECK